MVLAVLMLADTVDIPALTVQAADYKSAETVVADEQEAVSEENAAAMAAISANDAAAYGIATLADTTENPVQVTKSDGTKEYYATIYATRNSGVWPNGEIKLIGNAATGDQCFFRNGTITLNLDGNTLSAESYAFAFERPNCTIRSTTPGGKITGEGYSLLAGYDGVLYVGGSDASCTIESGVTIEATGYKPAVYACANLIIKEGVILKGNEALRVRPDGNVTIEGGTFQGKVYRTSGGTLQISGGKFENGIEVEGGTLADCFNGYGLKKSDGSIVDLTAASVSDSVYVYQIPFRITDQPTLADNQASVVEGYTAVQPLLSVTAAKDAGVTDTLSYQWRVKKLVGEDEVDEAVAGATGQTFQIPADLATGTYRYYCRVTCGSDSIDSAAVTFTVQAGLYGVAVNNGTETLYADLGAALDAIEEEIKTATAAMDITLTLRASVTDSAAVRVFSAGNYPLHLTVDLNGHELGKYGNSAWLNTRDQCCIGVSGEKAKLTVKDSSQEGNGELHGGFSVENGAALEMTGGKCAYIYIESGAEGSVKGGTCGMRAYIGNADDSEGNAGTSCEVQGGLLTSITVYGGAELTVTEGYTGKTDSLVVNHWAGSGDATKKQRALVSLAGGSYGRIDTKPYCTSEEDLETVVADPANGYAISDMLAEDYALFNNGFKLDLDRTALFYSNVEVKPADTPDDTELAVAEIVEDGTKVTYYTSWESVLDYLPGAGTVNSTSVEVVLLKDLTVTSATETVTLNKADKYILRSQEGSRFKITGDGGALLKLDCTETFIIDNITLEEGFIEASKGNVIVKDALLQNKTYKVPVIRRSNGYLALEQGARLVLEGADDATRTVELTGGARIFIAEGAGINSSNNGKYGILVSDTNNSLVVPEGAGGKNIDARLADGAGLTVYWTPDYLTDFIKGLEAENAAGKNITTYYQIRLPEGVSLPDGANSNISVLNGMLYGKAGSEITVGGITCAYQYATDTTGQISEAATTENKFIMPAATVTLITHEPDAYGYCAHCGKTDLAVSYQNGHLEIEGLTGRTYDSWPQMLTGITLVPGAGQTAVTLTMPVYRNNIDVSMLFACGTPYNPDTADFEVRYANNTAAYPYRAGEAGFDAAEAPRVTITGRGQYTGEFTVYFTIGKGTMQPQAKDFEACGSGAACYYDGRTEKAWNKSLVEFYGDASDAKQWSQCGGEAQQYIQQITTPDVMNTYAQGSVVLCPTTVEYSTDEKATWIMERLEGSSAENMYMITDAGEYPFWVRMTNVNCADAYISEKLVARILPKTLTEGMVDPVADAFAYYTGSGAECTAYDTGAISDSEITVDGSSYALVKDKDYTVTYENNIDITTGENKAKLIITGIGNYGGEATPIEREFEIRYAFTPAQTTVSKTEWYNGDVTALFGTSDNATDTSRVVYAGTLDEKLTGGLGSDIRVYDTLADAVDGTGAGYVFTGEGKITKTLYVRDVANGYVGTPVEVTLQIDRSAPVWEATTGNSGDFGISIKENWWKKLLNTVSFGRFYTDTTLDLVIRANDAKDGVNEISGVAEYYYYIDTVDASALSTAASGNGEKTAAAKTKAELDALKADGKFTEVKAAGDGQVTISGALSAEEHYIVYACAKDMAGNMSDYICSEGVVVDRTAPEITSATAPTKEAGTLTDHTATVTFETQEAGTVVYFCIGGYDDDTDFENNKSALQTILEQEKVVVKQVDGRWQPVVENGQTVSVSGVTPDPVIYHQSMQEGENAVMLSGLEADRGYRLYLIAIDEAGNLQTTYTMVDFTTRKVMPAVSVAPTLSGIYGTQAKDLKIGAGTMIDPGAPDTVVAGDWTFTDTAAGGEYPEPGTTKEYELTFTPKDTGFDSVSVKVVPTVAKKELTVYVEGSLEKTYNEENPEIGYVDVTEEPDFFTGLVNGDTQDSVKADMRLTTAATKTSAVGTYDFTVTSVSAKYDVKVKYRVSGAEGVSYPDHGTLTVKKADAALTVGSDSYAKTFGDDAFTLDVAASHAETAITYEVTDGTDVIAVTADGTVKILKAGMAKIRVSLPENTNYNAAADREITVTVAKKSAPTVADVNRNYYYERDHEDSVDIAKLLPADCGKITNNTTSAHDRILNCNFNEETGILTYTIQKNDGIGTGDIKMTIDTENYQTITIVIHTNWVDKREVYVRTGTEVALKSSVMTYGDRLSVLTFENAEFVDGDGNPVAGTLAWEDGSLIPTAGTASANWKFTPDDEAYIARTDSVGITVNKATPQADQLPVAVKRADSEAGTELIYHPAQTLADLKLTGGNVIWTVGDTGVTVAGTWSFSNRTSVPVAGTKNYEVIFTPEDGTNYKTLTKQISITVAQAKPYVGTAPVAAAITYGDSLADSALTGGSVLYGDGRGNASALPEGQLSVRGVFTWKQADTKPAAADSNRTEYTVVFTPEEGDLYQTVELALTLTVKKALNPPAMPGSPMTVSGTCEKVADVVLADGWVWRDVDRDTVLEPGVLTPATAVYTGADRENYEHVEVVVMLNRPDTADDDDSTDDSAGDSGKAAEVQDTEKPTAAEAPAHTAGGPAKPAAKPDTVKNSEAVPFIKGDNGREGWDAIYEEVRQIPAGEEVTVDMNGTTKVPGSLFDLIRGEDVNVVFDMGNGITWSVNGRDVTADDVRDIDFGVKYGAQAEGNIPVSVINNVTGEKFYTGLSLSYDGEFGFKAVLSLNMDQKNAGLYASLYYYNEQTGEMEFICEEEIAEDGSVELTFTHASEYILVVDAKAAEQEPADAETGDVQPADTDSVPTPAQEENSTAWWIFLLGAVIVAGVLVVFFVTKKGKKDGK